MSEPAVLADHIDRQTEEILAAWRASVARNGDVPEAKKLARDEFIDHVPEILDRLADRLRGRSADTVRPAKKHGALRWRQGYDIGAIVTELGYLRASLCRSTTECARAGGWDLDQLETAFEAIHDVLDEVAAESVRQFQEDSRRETQAALAEVKTRQAALEDAWLAAKLEQAKLRKVLAGLPIAVWVTDAEGAIIGANPEAARFGHGPGDPARRPDGTPCPADELPLRRALRGETVKQVELAWELDGGRRTHSLNAAPLTDDAGRVVGAVVAAVDITERKQLEASLEEERRLAEESSRHKGRLVAALSHDARTPLNAVVLAAELLEIHFDGETGDEEVMQCLGTIRHSVRNVLDLLNDLLDLSKIDAGAFPTEVSLFPLDAVLAECVASIKPQARLKGLDLRLDLGPLTDVSLETDRAKLKQILANLLSNALRYTERGHVRVWGERRPDHVRIAVEDTGVGIAPEDQRRIFEEYATLPSARRSAGESIGLGLAISLRLARLLGGDLSVRSTPGAGSTFTLTLPGSAQTRTPPPPEPAPSFEAAPAGTILIAEDHDDSRKTLAKVLRRTGYRVLEAADGREVLELVRLERPLAVLMDINMPGMDGIEATLRIRADARFRDLPIFALTGDVTPVNQHRIGEAGVDGYLEKPVTLEALRQALGSLARRGG